jgi:5'-deoxynucleotidase YfbR-like HD superfamily hydrolase
MLFDYIDILNSKSYQEVSLTIPPDLCDLVNNLTAVKRFQFKEYPPNVIIDDTYTHTLKCIGLARTSKLALNQALLERILWVHDIPEILIGDVTVTEKYRDTKIDREVEKSEEGAARQLLSTSDQELLKKFNAASDFLKGKAVWDENTIGFEAVFAKLIDNSEGNMTFHYFITNWVRSDEFEESLMPPLDSLVHTFITYRNFDNLVIKNLSQQNASALVSLTACVLDNIRACWRKVPSSRIPSELLKYL